MLTFSTLGTVPDEYVDCLAEGGDPDICRALHPETEPGFIEMPEEYVGRGEALPPATAGMQQVSVEPSAAGIWPATAALPKISGKAIVVAAVAVSVLGVLVFRRTKKA